MKKTKGLKRISHLLPDRKPENRKRGNTMLNGIAKELKDEINKVEMLINDKKKFFEWEI